MNILRELTAKNKSYWSERLLAQLAMAEQCLDGGADDALFQETVGYLTASAATDGTITKAVALECEKRLAAFGPKLKAYTILCAAHAHIDMNWMWGYAETVSLTLDTFRTMLDMMNEYPAFTFSQSQASVYEIVEKHDPGMLAEIKNRVREGRWEVTASTWVETDKNMPNGESLARHILYTKRYLSRLLDIPPDGLQIDFEPDTFGHNLNVPEILANGGVKYYYHCRGYDGHLVYRYQSPSGSQVLVYREPAWYNAEISADFPAESLRFCRRHSLKTALKVYGVGNHGGGPTRRDIEKLIDMNSWPLMPTIRFGRFIDFFEALEREAQDVPVVDRELNFIFDGCYTTQTRIKAANRTGELRLTQAELLKSLSAAHAGDTYSRDDFEQAWRRVLFNHFHDILPGSGVIGTREFALGRFNEALAMANTNIAKALRVITGQIDTHALMPALLPSEAPDGTTSEGAGVGFYIDDFVLPGTERSGGKSRVFHVFNTTAFDRTETLMYTLWDWPHDLKRLAVTAADGTNAPLQLYTGESLPKPHGFWGHEYVRLLVEVTCPAFGYNTYILSESDAEIETPVIIPDPRVDRPPVPVMENEHLKITFDLSDLRVLSLIDKKTGRELVSAEKGGASFRYIIEDPTKGMTAWWVGRYLSSAQALTDVRATEFVTGPLRSWVVYTGKINQSAVEVTVSLDADADRLDFKLHCDWFEKGSPQYGVPQLGFHVPLAYESRTCRCDIPFGMVTREPAYMDIPALSFTQAANDNGPSMMLMAKTKYGYRFYENSLSLDLIRSAYDPDPYPEIGLHTVEFAIQVVHDDRLSALAKTSMLYNATLMCVSGRRSSPSANTGQTVAAPSYSFIPEVEGCVISSVKRPEEESAENAILIRLYEPDGLDIRAAINFASQVRTAAFVDINEKPLPDEGHIEIEHSRVSFELAKYAMRSIRIVFQAE